MSDTQPAPQVGATRFAADGTMEIFDGQAWTPYRPPQDDGYGTIFKMIDLSATETRPPSGDQR